MKIVYVVIYHISIHHLEKKFVMDVNWVIKQTELNAHYVQIGKAVKIVLFQMEKNIVQNVMKDITYHIKNVENALMNYAQIVFFQKDMKNVLLVYMKDI